MRIDRGTRDYVIIVRIQLLTSLIFRSLYQSGSAYIVIASVHSMLIFMIGVSVMELRYT